LCPTEVSIAAEYENAHCSSKNCDLLSPRRLYDITKRRPATGRTYTVLRCPGNTSTLGTYLSCLVPYHLTNAVLATLKANLQTPREQMAFLSRLLEG
jgi:hypothetical protein